MTPHVSVPVPTASTAAEAITNWLVWVWSFSISSNEVPLSKAFRDWVEGFEPAAELDHPYLTDELRYGPPHPGPRWTAQLEAMDLESNRRSGRSLAEISADDRREVLRRALRGGSANLPGSPAQADHVVVGLLAWFYGTPLATDLCYGAEVGRHRCRGIRSLPEEPSPTGER
jgi:hypothetical protein